MELKPKEERLQYLSIIENHINEVIKGKASINKSLIANQLEKCYKDGTMFSIDIIKMDPYAKPFIMSTYPEVTELVNLSVPLMTSINVSFGIHTKKSSNIESFNDTWKGIKRWHIEIDSRLVDKKSSLCVSHGGEFVAIICHELGHIYNTHPVALAIAYAEKKARLSVYEKCLSGKKSMAMLFLPMYVCIDGLRIIVSKPINDISEFRADLHIPDEYKPCMVTYVDNHILKNPSAREIIVTEEDYAREVAIGAMFTTECVHLMKNRRNFLTWQLQNQFKLSNSDYIKKICETVSRSVSGKNIKTDEVDLRQEKYINDKFERDIDEAVKESMKILMESSSVEMRDIYLLKNEIDAIENASDKNYCTNLIFDYLERCTKKQNSIRVKVKNSKGFNIDISTIKTPEDEKIALLNELLQEVSNKHVGYDGYQYGLYIKYPDGYEG